MFVAVFVQWVLLSLNTSGRGDTPMWSGNSTIDAQWIEFGSNHPSLHVVIETVGHYTLGVIPEVLRGTFVLANSARTQTILHDRLCTEGIENSAYVEWEHVISFIHKITQTPTDTMTGSCSLFARSGIGFSQHQYVQSYSDPILHSVCVFLRFIGMKVSPVFRVSISRISVACVSIASLVIWKCLRSVWRRHGTNGQQIDVETRICIQVVGVLSKTR